ncbi:MAG: hypothetical protein ABIH38_05130 [Patescibacteria group bacterium]
MSCQTLCPKCRDILRIFFSREEAAKSRTGYGYEKICQTCGYREPASAATVNSPAHEQGGGAFC